MKIDLEQIQRSLQSLDLIPLIEQGFVAYSRGTAVVPPVGELVLDKGEVHIKYGFISEQPYYVIKIASGFYGNSKLGLSTSGGCMLVFSQETGELKCLLNDNGHLTDIRTGVAGAIAAKHLAPMVVEQIGIVGTGIQANVQLSYLRSVTDCTKVLVYGRSGKNLDSFVERAKNDYEGLRIVGTRELVDIPRECNLIVTTTPSKFPLLKSKDIRPGTHITAVGSDMPDKQELECEILARADVIVADSIRQCQLRGEISQAIRAGKIQVEQIVELGRVITGESNGRMGETDITIADLTGVAVQDIQIASAVFDHCVQGLK